MKKVKTVFLDAPTLSKSDFSMKRRQINGDQLARETQALIDEMEIDGYDFMFAHPITSSNGSTSYSEGTLFYFKLSETE